MKKIKNLYPIIALLLCLLLSNCTSKCTPSYFATEQHYLDISPDSIYQILLDKSDSLTLWDEQKQTDYWLVRLLAQSKCYINIDSDSVPLALEKYYRKKNQLTKAATAKYLQSTSFQDKNDYPRALRILLEILEQYNIPKDESINGHIYGTIGYIYRKTENNILEKKYYHMALEAYKNANDSTLLPSALADLANSYHPTKSDTVFVLLKEAKTLANIQGLHKRTRSINMVLASAYLEMDSLELAYNIIQELKNDSDLNSSTPQPIQDQYRSLQGRYYIQSNQYEKAFDIYKTLANSKSAHTQMSAISILAQLANIRGEYKKANSYYNTFLTTYKSLMSQKNLDAAQKYQALYDYHVSQEKEHLAKQDLKQTQLIFSYLAVGVTVCVSLIIILIIYAKNRKIQESHKHIEEATNKYLMAEENMLRAEAQMTRLKNEHETSKLKIDEQLEEIHHMRKNMIEAKKQVRSLLGQKQETKKTLTLDPDYLRLHQDEELKKSYSKKIYVISI